MTAVTERTRTAALSANEAFALDIVAGAAALYTNSDFYGRMGVARVRFTDAHVYGGHIMHFASEQYQPSHAFKYRGASAAVLQTETEGSDCVVAASTGSHGISLGLAAARAGLTAIVHAPDAIAGLKEERIRASGAKVVKGGNFLEATERAKIDDSGLFVHPFAMPAVRYGQGTLGLEIVDHMLANGLTGNDGDVIIPVAVAGGSHIIGIATTVWAAKRRGLLGDGVKVMGVQPQGNNTAMRARAKLLDGQEPVGLYTLRERQDPSVDALFIGEQSLDRDNLDLLSDTAFVERFCTLTNRQIGEALIYLAQHGMASAESAGALPTAFELAYARKYPYFQQGGNSKRVSFVLPVSGLNGTKESNEPFVHAATSKPVGSLLDELAASRRAERQSTNTRRRGVQPASSSARC